jgi:hypothetical protein
VRTIILTCFAACVLTAVSASAQVTSEVRDAFEAGRHQQVIDAAGAEASPALVFMAAQSQQKLGAVEAAGELYGRLAARPEDDPWHFIGLSATQLIANELDAALASAQQAAAMAGELADAHFQVGLTLARRQ